MNKYKENLDALDNARLTINKLCGKWLPKEVLDNLESYGDYELYNYVKYSVFKELVDKETPMKVNEFITEQDPFNPKDTWEFPICPNCKDEVGSACKYCYHCGQKIYFGECEE